MRKTVRSLVLLAFIISLLISAIEKIAFDKSFYMDMYESYNLSSELNLSEEEISLATDNLLNYLQGKDKYLNYKLEDSSKREYFFNKKERAHMVDVYELYQKARFFKYISYMAFLFLLLAYYHKGNFLILKDLKRSLGVFITVLIFLGTFALADFDLFWRSFHQVFFSNDLWLLDPNTDRLIMMVPEIFFQKMIIKSLVLFVIYMVVFSLFMYFFERRFSNDSHRSS